ncbi:MAG TPA: hypothetical protein PLI12_09975 [Acetobacteraceae bacterium]|jgi:hypothetical protein|nr:hypothetical protein [Acetobacteraceae bacterium]
MSKIMVRAAPGRLVRLPSGKKVPAHGMMVEENGLIRRWIANGDLQVLTPITAVAPTAPSVQPEPPPPAVKEAPAKAPGAEQKPVTPAQGYKA